MATMPKIIKKSTQISKMLMMGGIDARSALTIKRSPGARLIMRSGRSARKVRRDRNELNGSFPCPSCPERKGTIPRMEMITMTKSRMFHPVCRYAWGKGRRMNPIETIFRIISMTKHQVMMTSMYLR